MLTHFAVSGVETQLWLPPLVAFILSFFSSMVGIFGAFLLMPFQMSVLGYAGPSASTINLVFNLYATPGGIWRYARDRRMAWPLARLIILGRRPWPSSVAWPGSRDPAGWGKLGPVSLAAESEHHLSILTHVHRQHSQISHLAVHVGQPWRRAGIT